MRLASLLRIAIATAVVAFVGCDAILGIDDGIPREGGGPADSATEASPDAGIVDAGGDGDAAAPPCDVDASFGAPAPFTTLDGTGTDEHMRLLPPGELAVVYASVLDGGLGSFDLYTSTRTSIGDTWKPPTSVPGVNTSLAENDPSASADFLTLYFARAGGLYRATRSTTASAFGTPLALAAVNSGANDFGPYLVEDGSRLYFSSTRDSDAGVAQLFVTQPLADGGFAAPGLVSGVGTAGDNRFAAVTADQLVVYFASTRSGGQGAHDIWVATRAAASTAFGSPHVVAEVSSTADENPDWISADRCRLYLTSNRSGTYKLYVATKTPP